MKIFGFKPKGAYNKCMNQICQYPVKGKIFMLHPEFIKFSQTGYARRYHFSGLEMSGSPN